MVFGVKNLLLMSVCKFFDRKMADWQEPRKSKKFAN
jgi:hypothetical protein